MSYCEDDNSPQNVTAAPHTKNQFASCYPKQDELTTEHKRLQTKNSKTIAKLQCMDKSHMLTVSDFAAIHLFIEKPKKSKLQLFDIADTKKYSSVIECCFKIQRSALFVYGAPNLKQYHHWTLSTIGAKAFEEERKSVKFITLPNNQDSDYDIHSPDRPICIFTREKQFNGVPYLDLVQAHFTSLTSSNLMVELLGLLQTCNERKTRMVSIGYTNLEAKCWVRSAMGVDPGLLSKTYKLSKKLRLWCGEFMILLSFKFRATISGSGSCPNLYSMTNSRRNYLHKFAKDLGLPRCQWDELLVDAFSFLCNHHVGRHADVSNDHRHSFNYTHTASILVSKQDLCSDAKSLISDKVFPGNFVFLTGVAYTRNIIGTKSEKAEISQSIIETGFQKIVNELNKKDGDYDYRSFVDCQKRFEKYIAKHQAQSQKQTWKHKYVSRPACSDRMMYFSSFLDQFFQLRSNYQLTRRNWLELWAVTTRECNGQMLHFRVLSKWNSGSYMNTQNFSEALDKYRNLFFMFDQECFYLQPHLKKKQTGTTTPRFQNFVDPLCVTIDDISLADYFVDELQTKVVNILNEDSTCSDSTAELAYKLACTVSGIGPVRGLISVQLAGAMGIANAVFGLWGIVSKGSPKKPTGTYRFLNMHHPRSAFDDNKKDISVVAANEYFLKLLELIHKHVDAKFEKAQLEVSLCEIARRSRKKDVIFFESESENVQLFFMIQRTSKTSAVLKFLHVGNWNDVSDMFVPYHKMKNTSADAPLEYVVKSKENKLWVRTLLQSGKAELPRQMYKIVR